MSALSNREQAAASPGQRRPSGKAAKTMSIGVVLERLVSEFPEVTLSKIRFLESEGLISPQRTASGYRRFTQDDVERLRYILTQQRDLYLPLKVIREQLDAIDAGTVTPISQAAEARPMVEPEQFKQPTLMRLASDDVAERAGVSEALVQECAQAGVVRPDASGFFTADDARTVAYAAQLLEFGVDARHLKMLRQTAERQADLIGRAAAPVAHAKNDEAKERADEFSQQMSALVVSLHASMLKSMLRSQFR